MTTRTVASSTHAGSAGLAATINGCMFVFGVVLLLMGSLLPTLDVDVAKAGSLGAFPLAGILVATVIIGPVLDKTSAKASLVVSLLLIIVALVVMPSLGGFAALATVAFVYGLGAGVLNASTNILIATLNASGRGSALNLLGLFFSLGALSTPLLMAVTRGFMSPASVLYLLAAVCSLVLLLVLWQRFPPPLQASTPLRGLLRVLRNRAVWLFAALLFFESLEENCMFVWAGKVTDELLQMPVSHAEIPLLGLTAGMGFGRFVASRLLARLRSRTVILDAGALVALGSVVVLASGSSYPWMVAGFTLVGLGLSAIYPTALGLAGDRFPQETGTVFGAIIAISLVGGDPRAGCRWSGGGNPSAPRHDHSPHCGERDRPVESWRHATTGEPARSGRACRPGLAPGVNGPVACSRLPGRGGCAPREATRGCTPAGRLSQVGRERGASAATEPFQPGVPAQGYLAITIPFLSMIES